MKDVSVYVVGVLVHSLPEVLKVLARAPLSGGGCGALRINLLEVKAKVGPFSPVTDQKERPAGASHLIVVPAAALVSSSPGPGLKPSAAALVITPALEELAPEVPYSSGEGVS